MLPVALRLRCCVAVCTSFVMGVKSWLGLDLGVLSLFPLGNGLSRGQQKKDVPGSGGMIMEMV